MSTAAATFFVDTNCIVAAVCSWHGHHTRAAAEIERRLGERQEMATAAHTLAEAYAVLTRLPAPHRLSPADALTLIEDNFASTARVVALDAAGYRALLRRAGAEGIAGGRVYDAVIAQCAIKAGASVLLTFNPGHFEDLDPAGIRVLTPAAAGG